MRVVIHYIGDLSVQHLKDGCFQVLDRPNPRYITKVPLFISEERELYGVSLSLYRALRHYAHGAVFCVAISKTYDEKLDLFLQNNYTNTVLKLHKVRERFPSPDDLDGCEFDHNQRDLMYQIDLNDDDALDVRMISEERAKIQKTFDVTILTKTIEENYLVQRFLDINKNVVTYNHFMKKMKGHSDFMLDMFCDGRDDSYYQEHIYSDYTIKCRTIDEMNDVLDVMKINQKKLKTIRINFNKVRNLFE